MKIIPVLLMLLMILICIACEADLTKAISIAENINSSEIIKQIENNKNMKYNNVRIIGDLNFTAEKTIYINSSLDISNSNFTGRVNFAEAVFLKPVKFEGTIFEKDASFQNATFKDEAIFYNAIFKDKAIFLQARFVYDSNFIYTNFNNNAYFDSANFYRDANYEYSKFSKYSSFKDVEFQQGAVFSSTKFKGRVEFNKARFDQRSYFDGAIFDDYIKFNGANFNKNVHFDKRTDFKKDLNLSDTTIHSIWIDDAKFGNKSRISLNDSEINMLMVNWIAIKEKMYYNAPVYLALIKNFHDLRQFDYEDDCYYRYREAEQAKKSLGLSKIGDIVLWITCGYGVDIWRTILSSIILIFFFGLIFYFTNFIRGAACSKFRDKNEHISFPDALYFSLMTFISAPTDFKHPVRWLVPLERITGWFIWAIFVFTLVRIGMR